MASSFFDPLGPLDPFAPSAPSLSELYNTPVAPQIVPSKRCSGVVIAVIVIAALLFIAIVVLLVVQAVEWETKIGGDDDDDDDRKKSIVYIKRKEPTTMSAPNYSSGNGGGNRMMARAPAPQSPSRPRHHNARMMQNLQTMYPQSQYQIPTYDVPGPMPQAQLMQAPLMPVDDVYLPGVPSSSAIIGDAQFDIMTTEAQGTSIDAFRDNTYLMDPAMLTPGSPTDIQGLQTFMPYMGGGVGENDNQTNGDMGGPVDPNTGLPLFTTGKLIRSQLLGGHGAGSFLRQVQDPMTGYKKSVGRNLCGVQQARRDVEIRRKQLNAARLEHPDADPVLFNSSDFAYN